MRITQSLLALVAALFGLVTILAGTSVLLGSDPGYIVFRPLLIYNTAMGVVYVAAGIIIWRNFKQGMYVAAVIFILNLVALAAICFLYTKGSAIAADSLRAMSLRTLVWFVLVAGLGWLSHRNKLYAFKPNA